MPEMQRIVDLIDSLRVTLNAHGDSDESVLIRARDRIFSRANEVGELHERIREMTRETKTNA